jgi:hypothetical protein
MCKTLPTYPGLLMVLVFVYGMAFSQPCPERNTFGSETAPNYFEIQSQGKTINIYTDEIQVFPGGKERIYILLPDILTENNTPIIRWNELVLKKPLNSDVNWSGDIDKVSFYPTPCFPNFETPVFSGGQASNDFKYVVNGSRISIEGSITFTLEDKIVALHLGIQDKEIPKPMINDLDGEIYLEKNGPMNKLTITTGEMLYHPQNKTLKVSGSAEGGEINQVIDFMISGFEGNEGVFPVNGGNTNEDAYHLYQITGGIKEGLRIKKYALPPNPTSALSFFDTLPFDLNVSNLNELVLLGEYHGNTILVDPKPAPIVLPFSNNAFEGKPPTFEQLKLIKKNPTVELEEWENEFVVNYENLPVWGIDFEGNLIGENQYSLLVKNISLSPGQGANGTSMANRLTYTQVDAINNGFLGIFEQFDKNKDTLQLKTGILALLEENQLPVNASLEDDFESFLVTTVSEFREAEKYALDPNSKVPTNDINASKLLPAELRIDPSTGRPLKRTFNYSGTSIAIDYGDQEIEISAENESQGHQKLTLASTGDLFDLQQFYAVLSHMPMEEGTYEDLTFFDLRPITKITYINGKRFERIFLEPNYVHAAVRVIERESFDGEDIFKVEVKFNGLNNPLFAESLEDNKLGAYRLSASYPHKIYGAYFEEGLTLLPK